MSKTYELVNPFILGTFDRKFTADNSIQAAHLAYQSLSQYFTGHIPRFKFTLQRVKSNYFLGGGKEDDYLHFETYETKSKDKSNKNKVGIEYVIKPLKHSIQLDNFQEKLQNFLKRKKIHKKISRVLTSESEEDSEQSQESEEQKGGNLTGENLTGGNLTGENLTGGDLNNNNNNLNSALTGGDLNNNNNNLNSALTGGKKYVEDEELDPELEKLLYEDEMDFKKKKKTKKGWTALNGPLRGQTVYPSPISYYRYDPVIYTEYLNYVPVFTEAGRPKRMVYDIYYYDSLKR